MLYLYLIVIDIIFFLSVLFVFCILFKNFRQVKTFHKECDSLF